MEVGVAAALHIARRDLDFDNYLEISKEPRDEVADLTEETSDLSYHAAINCGKSIENPI